MISIVAFLQNPWFKQRSDFDRVVEMYRDNQEFHKKILLMSMSGRRLYAAFKELYNVIHWDNSNWRSGKRACDVLPPDHAHMLNVIKLRNPRIILTFGNQARDALSDSTGTRMMKLLPMPPMIMSCHHPNARHMTQEDMCVFAVKVRQEILRHEEVLKEPTRGI